MAKARKRGPTFALYLTTVGLTLYFETMILIFFDAYAYYPMIIQNNPDPFNDILAGNLFSQFCISTTVLLAVTLDLKFYWYFVLGFFYGMIEELFMALGIYSHNWYQTWMTVLGFPLLTWFIKKINSWFNQGIKPITYCGYIYMGLFALYVVTLLWGLDLAGLMRFANTLFKNPRVSRYGLYLVYYTLSAMSMIYVIILKPRLSYKFSAIVILYAVFYIAYKQHLIMYKEGYFFPVTTITIIWSYLSVFLMDRLYGRPHKPPHLIKG
jgi:hypothetical protein